MLSEELSYEYYYCYVLLSADNISVVVFLTRKGRPVAYLVILGYQSVRLVHECFVAHGLYCSRKLNF